MVKANRFAGLAIAAMVIALCWPGPAAHAADGYRLLRMDGNHVKWGASSAGTGAQVSYAFVTRAMQFPHARNCSGMTPLDGLLAASRLSEADLHREAAAAFAAWEKVADITFTETGDPDTAQILIGAQAKPRWFAFTNVAYHLADKATFGTIDRALICLNPQKKWKAGFDGNLDVYNLRYTFTHEIGHAIGLDHPGATGQIMAFTYQEAFRTLQPGDIAGIDRLYGAKPAPVNLASEAPLPVVPATAPQ